MEKMVWSLFKNVFLLSVILSLSACQTSDIKPKLEPEMKTIEAPKARETSFNDALMRFGQMVSAYTGSSKLSPIYIQSKPITNDTAAGGLPADLSRMVVTTLSKIGKPFVYIAYDPSYVSNEQSLGGTVSRLNPEILISGAIAEYDENTYTESDGTNLNLSAPLGSSSVDGEAGRENSQSQSRLTLDFQMLDYTTQATTGAHASNTITIRKQSKSQELGFFLFGNGIGINGSVNRNQGIHAAIRKLVELSVLQLLGRQYDVPYWRLMSGMEPDKMILRNLREELSQFDKDQAIDFLFNMHGFNSKRHPRTPNNIVKIVNNLLQQSPSPKQVGSVDEIDYEIIMEIYLQIPVTSRYLAKIREKGSQEPEEESAAVEATPEKSTTAQDTSKAASIPFSMTLSTDQGKGKQFKTGESMTLNLTTTRNAHVNCFWEQATGSIIKIFPNRFRPDEVVPGERVLLVPDSGMPFKMVFDTPNSSEQIVCFSSPSNFSNQLPVSITQSDLKPLRNMSIDDLSKIYTNTGATPLAEEHLVLQIQ
jgi:hypothetical protein